MRTYSIFFAFLLALLSNFSRVEETVATELPVDTTSSYTDTSTTESYSRISDLTFNGFYTCCPDGNHEHFFINTSEKTGTVRFILNPLINTPESFNNQEIILSITHGPVNHLDAHSLHIEAQFESVALNLQNWYEQTIELPIGVYYTFSASVQDNYTGDIMIRVGDRIEIFENEELDVIIYFNGINYFTGESNTGEALDGTGTISFKYPSASENEIIIFTVNRDGKDFFTVMLDETNNHTVFEELETGIYEIISVESNISGYLDTNILSANLKHGTLISVEANSPQSYPDLYENESLYDLENNANIHSSSYTILTFIAISLFGTFLFLLSKAIKRK